MTAEEQLRKWFDNSQQISPVRLAKFDRKRLVEHFGIWGFKKGAEIGVDRGRFSEYMFKKIEGLELMCVDPWHWKLRGESRYNSTVERLKSRPANIRRLNSMDAVGDVLDGELDFVYIDGDHHFDFVMRDIIEWSKKVRIGGIVAGHDYYRFRQAGVVPAVDIYTRMHGIYEWFLCDERTPSWFWLKQDDPWERPKDGNQN